MPKFTKTPVTADLLKADDINENLEAWERLSQRAISRDGTGPNALVSSIDMNGFDLLNVDNLEAIFSDGNEVLEDFFIPGSVWITTSGITTLAGNLELSADTDFICLGSPDRYCLPATDGDANQFMMTNGDGQVSFLGFGSTGAFAPGSSSAVSSQFPTDTPLNDEAEVILDAINASGVQFKNFAFAAGNVRVTTTAAGGVDLVIRRDGVDIGKETQHGITNTIMQLNEMDLEMNGDHLYELVLVNNSGAILNFSDSTFYVISGGATGTNFTPVLPESLGYGWNAMGWNWEQATTTGNRSELRMIDDEDGGKETLYQIPADGKYYWEIEVQNPDRPLPNTVGMNMEMGFKDITEASSHIYGGDERLDRTPGEWNFYIQRGGNVAIGGRRVWQYDGPVENEREERDTKFRNGDRWTFAFDTINGNLWVGKYSFTYDVHYWFTNIDATRSATTFPDPATDFMPYMTGIPTAGRLFTPWMYFTSAPNTYPYAKFIPRGPFVIPTGIPAGYTTLPGETITGGVWNDGSYFSGKACTENFNVGAYASKTGGWIDDEIVMYMSSNTSNSFKAGLVRVPKGDFPAQEIKSITEVAGGGMNGTADNQQATTFVKNGITEGAVAFPSGLGAGPQPFLKVAYTSDNMTDLHFTDQVSMLDTTKTGSASIAPIKTDPAIASWACCRDSGFQIGPSSFGVCYLDPDNGELVMQFEEVLSGTQQGSWVTVSPGGTALYFSSNSGTGFVWHVGSCTATGYNFTRNLSAPFNIVHDFLHQPADNGPEQAIWFDDTTVLIQYEDAVVNAYWELCQPTKAGMNVLASAGSGQHDGGGKMTKVNDNLVIYTEGRRLVMLEVDIGAGTLNAVSQNDVYEALGNDHVPPDRYISFVGTNALITNEVQNGEQGYFWFDASGNSSCIRPDPPLKAVVGTKAKARPEGPHDEGVIAAWYHAADIGGTDQSGVATWPEHYGRTGLDLSGLGSPVYRTGLGAGGDMWGGKPYVELTDIADRFHGTFITDDFPMTDTYEVWIVCRLIEEGTFPATETIFELGNVTGANTFKCQVNTSNTILFTDGTETVTTEETDPLANGIGVEDLETPDRIIFMNDQLGTVGESVTSFPDRMWVGKNELGEFSGAGEGNFSTMANFDGITIGALSDGTLGCRMEVSDIIVFKNIGQNNQISMWYDWLRHHYELHARWSPRKKTANVTLSNGNRTATFTGTGHAEVGTNKRVREENVHRGLNTLYTNWHTQVVVDAISTPSSTDFSWRMRDLTTPTDPAFNTENWHRFDGAYSLTDFSTVWDTNAAVAVTAAGERFDFSTDISTVGQTQERGFLVEKNGDPNALTNVGVSETGYPTYSVAWRNNGLGHGTRYTAFFGQFGDQSRGMDFRILRTAGSDTGTFTLNGQTSTFQGPAGDWDAGVLQPWGT